MVCAARLRWFADQLAQGRQVRARLNSYSDRVTFNLVLLPIWDSTMLDSFANHLAQLMPHSLQGAVVVDHGHSSSTGAPRISVSMKRVPPVRAFDQPAGEDPGGHGGGDEPGRGGLPPGRRHRDARRPAPDPRRGHGVADPWAATAAVPKKPRTRGPPLVPSFPVLCAGGVRPEPVHDEA
eukprot:2215396-Pyramimonas_sp.AAC.1